MKTDLSDQAQQALIAYQIIQQIKSINPNQNRFAAPHASTFKQELIHRNIINLDVVSKHNFDKVMEIFFLRHSLHPSSPFFFKNDYQFKGNNVEQTHEYYPTETTKTLFNILLNKKRHFLILSKYGLAKNIAVYLLWHLSALITRFRIKEGMGGLESFVNKERFAQIPKCLYYELKDQEERVVLQKLQKQCQELIIQCDQQYLQSFCNKATQEYGKNEIRTFYMFVTIGNHPSWLLKSLAENSHSKRNTLILKNIRKMIGSQPRQMNFGGQFLSNQNFGDTYLTYDLDTVFPYKSFSQRSQHIRKQESLEAASNYFALKEFCKSSNRLINYQRTFFLLRQRQFYHKMLIQKEQSEHQQSRYYEYAQQWPIEQVRDICKQLSLIMHDDEQLYSIFQGELEMIDLLANTHSPTFTLLQAQFISRTLKVSVTQRESFIELPPLKNYKMLDFQTQCATNNLSFTLQTMKRYLSINLFSFDDCLQKFWIIIGKIMSEYPQRFTLLINGKPLKIRTQQGSSFLQINQRANIVNIDLHIKTLLNKVLFLGKPPYYLSACPSKPNKKVSISWSDRGYFDSILLKWDSQHKQYDLKTIQWAFSEDIQDYWDEGSLQKKDAGIIQTVIQLQGRIQTDLNIQMQHIIICPQKAINQLRQKQYIRRQDLQNKQNIWKITLAAIEDVRFSDFTFHEEYLSSIVNQLFESFILPKGHTQNIVK